jgi:hypothetical protein
MLMDDLCKLHKQFEPHLFDDDYEDQNLKVESVCSLTPGRPCFPKRFWPLSVTFDEASKIAVIFWNFYWE